MPAAVSHYQILNQLGEGGMGAVYQARDTRLGRAVALKFLAPRLLGSAPALERFLGEARAISSLNHPNIATLYDVVEDGGAPVLVLEYLPGGTLRARTRGRRLPLAELVEYGLQIAAGLAHAHGRGLVHRDVKTENMLFTEDGRLKITDFGLANVRGAAGTLAYLAPECAQGAEADRRADIFSLGVMLYEMTAGELPFRGESARAMLYDLVHQPAPSLRQIRPDLPEAFERVVRRALAKDRERRWQSMEELADGLRSLEAMRPSILPTVEFQPVAAGPAATRKILVVEDEDDLRKTLGFSLSSEGYQIVDASNGREGVRVALEERPDLVLLDVMMPGLNGLDVCRELRRSGFHAPIIMVTGRAEEIDRVVGLEIGADDYVVKPFGVRELVARVRAQLRREAHQTQS